MRILNLFLITLLCFAIPLQGSAGWLVGEDNCPSESAQLSHSADKPAHDCCTDKATQAKTGKACKAEQDCQTGGPMLLNQLEKPLATFYPAITKPFTDKTYLSFDAFTTWRPPTLA
ncbi:hypothetical protein KEF85_14645 [Methylomonas paludis]|uniref:Uncharacterized protein n=1 Tax=Methylomonas paludis TaxID=1173101 RepID=A0A975R9S7_9GAMM|nr:hypothetical protein [Methylomonas paludis]QWF70549.1 hypothetical protein KEF85_14645 [Methylomonas paludis]